MFYIWSQVVRLRKLEPYSPISILVARPLKKWCFFWHGWGCGVASEARGELIHIPIAYFF